MSNFANFYVSTKIIEKLFNINWFKIYFLKVLNKKKEFILFKTFKKYILREEVQITTEVIIQEVNEISEKMISQINQYEKERVKEYRDPNEKKVGFIEMVKELKQFHSEWSNYIKKFTICEKDVNRANSLAQDFKDKSKIEKINIENFNFNGKYLKYKKNQQFIRTEPF